MCMYRTLTPEGDTDNGYRALDMVNLSSAENKTKDPLCEFHVREKEITKYIFS